MSVCNIFGKPKIVLCFVSFWSGLVLCVKALGMNCVSDLAFGSCLCFEAWLSMPSSWPQTAGVLEDAVVLHPGEESEGTVAFVTWIGYQAIQHQVQLQGRNLVLQAPRGKLGGDGCHGMGWDCL